MTDEGDGGATLDARGVVNIDRLDDTDQRWQSFTIGLLMIIGLIVVGNVFYIILHLLRRGRA